MSLALQKSYLEDSGSRPSIDVVVGFQSRWKTAYVARLYEYYAQRNSSYRIAVTPHELQTQVNKAKRGEAVLFDNEFVDSMNKFYFASALRLAKVRGVSVLLSLTDYKHVGDQISGSVDYILRFVSPKQGKIYRLWNNYMGKRSFQFLGNLSVGLPNESFYQELRRRQKESHAYFNPRGADAYDHLTYSIMNLPVRDGFKQILEKKYTNVVLITGRTGGGKSSLSLSIASEMDEDFDPNTHVLYRPNELLRIPKRFSKGSWVVWDEAELAADSRRFMTHNSVEITQMFETFRDRFISVVINCPEEGLIDTRLRGNNIVNWHIIPYHNQIENRKLEVWPQFYVVGKRKLSSETKIVYGFEEHWTEPEASFTYIPNSQWAEYQDHKWEILYGKEAELEGLSEEDQIKAMLAKLQKANQEPSLVEESLSNSI